MELWARGNVMKRIVAVLVGVLLLCGKSLAQENIVNEGPGFRKSYAERMQQEPVGTHIFAGYIFGAVIVIQLFQINRNIGRMKKQ
jgi:hypothetical protein